MMSYRDTTFCAAFCATTECRRNYSDVVKAAAERWWGGPGAPVAFADFSDGCDDYVPTGGVGTTQANDSTGSSHAPADQSNGLTKNPFLLKGEG